MLTVQLGAVPAMVMLALGITVVLLEAAEIDVAQTRELSISEMVTATPFKAVFSLVD